MMLRLLGPIVVDGQGGPLRLGPPRHQRLLAALMLERGRAVPVWRLIDAMWDDEPPSTAHEQVHNATSALRRLFVQAGTGPEVLVTTTAGVTLGGDTELDLDRVDALVAEAQTTTDAATAARLLREAAGVWRGPSLASLTGRYFEAAAARLDSRRLSILEDCFDRELESAPGNQLIAEIDALVAAHPFRERLIAQRMRALRRAGRRADALASFREVRRRFQNELGIEPGAELVALHQEILRESIEVIDALSDPDAHDIAASADHPRPRQLPAPTRTFVGRTDAISAVLAHAAARAPGGVAVVSIAGMPGVGKTALVRHVAHQLATSFRSCLYAELTAAGGVRVDSGSVTAAFLRAYGLLDSSIPVGIAERGALFRSVTAHDSVLVVLDNADNETQIRDLVPGSDALVLVTSRRPMIGVSGVHVVDLEPLDDDSAREFLVQAIGGDRIAQAPAAADRLIAQCGALPLALEIVSMRLRLGDECTLGDLVRRLDDERTRLGQLAVGDLDVNSAFRVALRDISVAAAALLSRLSGLPLRTYPRWLCDAMQDHVPDTVTAVDELRRARLLQAAGERRFRIHDLIRLYAAPPDSVHARSVLETATRKMLAVARTAADLVPSRAIPRLVADIPTAPIPDGWTGAEWLDGEIDSIVAFVEALVVDGRSDLGALMANAAVNHLLVTARCDAGEHLCRAVLTGLSSGTSLLPRDEAATRVALAAFLRIRDRHPDALDEARAAYRAALRHGDPELLSACALAWAVSSLMLGRHRSARAATGAMIRWIAETAGGAATGYALLTAAHLRMVPAAEAIRAAQEHFRAAGDLWGEAEASGFLAQFVATDAETEACLVRSAELYETLGDPLGTVSAQLYLAEYLIKRGQPAPAIPRLRRALADARRAHHDYFEARILKNIGQVHRMAGRIDPALSHLNAAIGIYQRLAMPRAVASVLVELARTHTLAGDIVKAEALEAEAARMRSTALGAE